MRSWARADPREYRQLDLRAHEILADVPLHDVWRVELPGGGEQRTIADVRSLMSTENLLSINPVVRALVGLRELLGRVFRWDSPDSKATDESLVHRLTQEDLRQSVVEPGSADGAFSVLYVHRYEAANEIRNSTVHAFSVIALQPRPSGYRLFWAIYVSPVGPITAFYMALIDPFRRFIIYPAVLRYVLRSWREKWPETAS